LVVDLHPLNLGEFTLVELAQPCGAERGYFLVNGFRRCAQACQINALTDRREIAQAWQSAPEHFERTGPIALLDL
jgi:hypothetical protein